MAESALKRVYFAGKVAKNGGYRGELLGSHSVMSSGYKAYRVGGGQLIYGGPFAISCDHGCFHQDGRHGLLRDESGGHLFSPCIGSANDLRHRWDNHGGYWVMHSTGLDRKNAVSRCLEQISQCDAVYAEIECTTCYGTLVELGYAAAKNKDIYVRAVGPVDISPVWFALELPDLVFLNSDDPFPEDLLALDKSHKERYHDYLLSDEWKTLREQKLEEADHSCQLCNGNRLLHVHHRTYDRVFNEHLSDLVVLCKSCHEKFHDIVPDME